MAELTIRLIIKAGSEHPQFVRTGYLTQTPSRSRPSAFSLAGQGARGEIALIVPARQRAVLG